MPSSGIFRVVTRAMFGVDEIRGGAVDQLGILLSSILAAAVEVFFRSVGIKSQRDGASYAAAGLSIKTGNQNELRRCISS